MALTRDDIVSTALRLLDAHGLDGLSLRRLAGELGISAPTLYWHIRDKRELLDLVAERIITSYRAALPASPPDPAADPWDRLADAFRQQYLAILSHRDAARVFAGNRPTEAMLPVIEQWLGLWVGIGFPPGEALTCIIAVSNYVLGAALEYEAEAEREALGTDEAAARAGIARPYLLLFQAAESRQHRDRGDRHADFEHGLKLLMTGLKAHLDQLAVGPSTPPAHSPPRAN
jgi:TetR/AcrR family transcriptional regulator, tetracycline repressor protein